MSEPLYTICYFSKSNIADSDEAIKEQIHDILSVANIKNTASGVTGALLYSGGYFVQVLEGPESSVEDIFESIQNDLRHREVVVIKHSHVNERSFPKWSMALAGVDKQLIPGLEGILTKPDDIVANPSGVALVRLLTNLLIRYEEDR
jgi:hypothetical protein